MNRHMARALLADAFYQVLDNKVFRLLVLGCLCLIALTFLIGFKDDGISFLFGWKFVSYADFARSFGATVPPTKELNVAFIQGTQALFIEQLAGSFGLMFCIAATAFFIPRMLERGEADVVFSKPVSRFVLLLARYASGIVFVGLLAFVLVLGMHAGFLVTSGYSDPAFLWSALTLVYVFALVHALSTAVAVLTRNAIAPILVALTFFMFNGCVHGIWVAKEHGQAKEAAELELNETSADGDRPKAASPLVVVLVAILDVFHYALPKTHDADVIAQKLRSAVSAPEHVLRDPAGQLAVTRDPESFVRAGGDADVDLQAAPAVWTTSALDGTEAGRIVLSRRSRMLAETDKKGKPKRQSASQAALEALRAAEKLEGLARKPTKERQPGRTIGIDLVRWTEARPSGNVERTRGFFALEDSMFEIDATLTELWLDPSTRAARLSTFFEGFTPVQEGALSLEAHEWYPKVFGWNAPLKYNAAFSIATSLLFAALMLGIAQWRLSRIDF